MNVADLPPREGLAEALARLHSRRVLLICGPSRRYVERLAPAFAGLELEVFAGARRHVPQELLAEARQKLDGFQADTVVALGGGSAIGFGKALRLDRDVHFVAVPTTYAGSEMTTLWGTTHDGVKTTGRDPRVRPDVVIHDVDLTVEMPKPLTVTSLMNALAHPKRWCGRRPTGARVAKPRAGLALRPRRWRRASPAPITRWRTGSRGASIWTTADCTACCCRIRCAACATRTPSWSPNYRRA